MNPDKSRVEVDQHDQSTPSLESIIALLQETPDIPSSVRQFFGGENVRKVVTFFTSGEIVDIDALKLAEQLTDEEYIQYLSVVPSMHQIKYDIIKLAEMLVEAIRPKFRDIARSCVRFDNKNDLISVHNKITKLIDCLSGSFRVSFRGAGLRELQSAFLIRFFREMEKIFDSHESRSQKKTFFNQRKILFQHWKNNTGGNYPPSSYAATRKAIDLILSNGRFSSNLKSAFPPAGMHGENFAELESDMETELEEIRELSKYRKITLAQWEHHETRLYLMADNEPFKTKSCMDICFGSILVNPLEDLVMPTLVKDAAGYESALFQSRDGKIDFSISAHNGEIVFIGLPGITLREFMPRPQYMAIKKRIYDVLLAYLRSKDPDVEDLFLKPLKIAEASVETGKIIDDVKSDVLENVPANEIDESAAVQSDYPVVSSDNPESGTEEPAKTLESEVAKTEIREISDTKKISLLSRLKGLKGQKVLSALKRLLGEPKRIQGSHVIFESQRNGVTKPFPIHFSYDINPFILSRNLQKMGYRLDEFCEIV